MRFKTLRQLALLVPLCAIAQPVAYIGARIIPVVGPEIADGVLIVDGGKIRAIGARAAVTIPANAKRVDAAGKLIMPGLVDSHSHVGGPAGADSSGPIQPEVRVLDSINVRAASIQKAQSGGVTVANIMPGSGHLNSGQTLYLKLRDGGSIDDLLIKLPDGRNAGGMKMANGSNPRRASPFPGTRGKAAAMMREQLIKAQEYRDKVKAAGTDASKLPPRDLRSEALVEVLEQKRTVHFHTHRNDDILTVLRLAKEFNFKVVLQHASDAWAVADEIAKAKVWTSLIVLDSPGGKIEAKDVTPENAMVLDKAGAPFGFHTDDGVTESRLFLRSAALAVRAGCPRDKAIYALTMAGAKMLELDERIGSLEVGKDADFIVLSGDPFSVYTKVLQTYVDGVNVFDRSNEKDKLYQTGGYGASHDELDFALIHGPEEQ